MRKIAASALAVVAAVALTVPAQAGDADGKIQVKLLGTAVLPDGGLKAVSVDPGLPSDSQTEADDNYVPTLAVEYFFSPTVSVETICCVTQHDVHGLDGIDGAMLVSDAKIIPATFTLKFHPDTGSAFKPYVGAGPTYFLFFDEQPGATSQDLGAVEQNLKDSFGLALQAGFDLALNDEGLALTVDAKRYFIDVEAEWYDADGDTILATEHDLDPWVLSAGIAYRF